MAEADNELSRAASSQLSLDKELDPEKAAKKVRRAGAHAHYIRAVPRLGGQWHMAFGPEGCMHVWGKAPEALHWIPPLPSQRVCVCASWLHARKALSPCTCACMPCMQ